MRKMITKELVKILIIVCLVLLAMFILFKACDKISNQGSKPNDKMQQTENNQDGIDDTQNNIINDDFKDEDSDVNKDDHDNKIDDGNINNNHDDENDNTNDDNKDDDNDKNNNSDDENNDEDDRPNPIVNPTPPEIVEDKLFTFMIEEHEFYLGEPFVNVTKHFPISKLNDGDKVIEAGEKSNINIVKSDGSNVLLGLYNNTDKAIPLKYCVVYSITVYGSNSNNIYFLPTEQSIDFSMSIESIKNIIGDYDSKISENGATGYMWLWRQSKGQKIISIGFGFNDRTGKMEFACIAREPMMW